MDDKQQQLVALKRGLCGDCGVGPFKGGRRGKGLSVSHRVLWLAAAAVVVGCAIFVAFGLLQ
jgi:hypothetical protein